MTHPQAFSYSRLNNYAACPRQFHEIHILKRVKEVESQAMKDGKTQHKALELRVKVNKKLPPEMAKHEPAIKKFIAYPGVKQTELQMAIRSDFSPCDWFDPRTGPPQVWCRAIVDLGVLAGENALLVDYKTGKISPDFTQLRLTGAVYLHNHPEVNKVNLAFWWLKHDKFDKESMTRAEIPEIWDGLMPKIEKYQEAFAKQEFPPRPDRHCKWCVVQSCPYWEGAR